MKDKIRIYVDNLFNNIPTNNMNYSLKEELLKSLNEYYENLIKMQVDEDIAYSKTISYAESMNKVLELKTNYIQKKEDYRQKSGIRVAIAVIMYILCPVSVITLQNEFGVVLLLLMIALSTGILIYDSNMNPVSLDEEKEYKYSNMSYHKRKHVKQVESIIWSITVIVYFVVSFMMMNWHISWVIFIIGAVVQKMYLIYCDMHEEDAYEKK